jgi:SAM-dependent methyltransferase
LARTSECAARVALSLPPVGARLSLHDIWGFYQNVYAEAAEGLYDAGDHARVFDYFCGFGNMAANPNYYRRHFCAPLQRATASIFRDGGHPRVLDLCCGVGTQSILFALLGAQVVAVDVDADELATMRKRIGYYEQRSGRTLDIVVRQADLRQAGLADFGAFDSVYSHFGIDQLRTAEEIFSEASRSLRPTGTVLLKAMNPQCIWYGRNRPPVDPRGSYLDAARRHGFEPEIACGTGLPRPFWRSVAVGQGLSQALGKVAAFNGAMEYAFRRS